MQVTVKFFATYREIVGSKELTVPISEGATLRSLLDAIYAKHPRLKGFEETMLLAVNHEFAEPTARLREGDEVALMPPVSGGAGGFVEIRRKAIDVDAVVASVHRLDAGVVVLFLGTVRSDPGVKALDYEVYRPMALKTMAGIVAGARKRFGVLEMTIVHRLGRVPVGRPSVAIAASTAHRREAFDAASWAMDEMKKVVPIWKTEG
jgi:molybdopterin synthase catalytic subunit